MMKIVLTVAMIASKSNWNKLLNKQTNQKTINSQIVNRWTERQIFRKKDKKTEKTDKQKYP